VLQSAFPIIVLRRGGGVSVVMSLVFLFSRGSAFDHIGDGGLTGESDPYGSPPAQPGDVSGSRAEQEMEIRQMLKARRRATGRPRRAAAGHRRRGGQAARAGAVLRRRPRSDDRGAPTGGSRATSAARARAWSRWT